MRRTERLVANVADEDVRREQRPGSVRESSVQPRVRPAAREDGHDLPPVIDGPRLARGHEPLAEPGDDHRSATSTGAHFGP